MAAVGMATGRSPGGALRRGTAEVVAGRNLQGRVVLVTGGASGLGLEVSKAMCAAGATVVLAARTLDRSREGCDAVRRHVEAAAAGAGAAEEATGVPTGCCVPLAMDLESLDSVRRGYAEFKATGLPLHTLVANGGVMAIPRREASRDGFERQYAVNFLSHVLLTSLALPHLEAARGDAHGGGGGGAPRDPPPRIVHVASRAHRMAYRDAGARLAHTDDVYGPSSGGQLPRYTPFGAYGASKLAQIWHAQVLDRRLEVAAAAAAAEAAAEAAASPQSPRPRVEAVALHPGLILTGIQRHQPVVRLALAAASALGIPLGKTPDQGAAEILHACLAPPGLGGAYLADLAPRPERLTKQAADGALADRVVQRALDLTATTS